MGVDRSFDPSSHRDLTGGEPPTGIATGPTDDVVALAQRMLERLDDLADAAVERVAAEVSAYGGDSGIQREDLWWSCYRNTELMLRLIAEDRPATREELRARRAVGARRAAQGMPVEDMLRGFQTGVLALWEHLVSVGEGLGPVATSQLLGRAGRIWAHLNEVSTAVAEAHRLETARQDAAAQRGPATMLRDLERWPGERSAEQTARQLGFDPDGVFLAALFRGPGGGWPYAHMVLRQPDRTVMLCATGEEDPGCEEALLDRLLTSGAETIGIGLVRRGLAGAQATLRDAERAHAAARALGRDGVRFRVDWFAALVVDHRGDLEPVVADAESLLREDEEVRDTLEAYIAAHGRTAAAAKLLAVHPNTVTYRLDRFQRRVGVDARSFEGALTARLADVLRAATPAGS